MEVSLFHAETRQERDNETCSRHLRCERIKHVTLNAIKIFSDFLNIKQSKLQVTITVKKVKGTLVQALRLFTGRTVYRGGGRGIALPFHDHGTRRG